MKNFFIGLVVGLTVLPLVAQEKITNGSPLTFPTPTSISEYQPVRFCLVRQVTGYTDHPNIHIELAPSNSDVVITGRPLEVFDYPNPAAPTLDTDAEVTTLIGQFKSVNLSVAYNPATGVGNLWQRIQWFLCRDFPGRFNGGCTVS